MKGIEDFIYVFVIAIIVIAVFSVISAFFPYEPGPSLPSGYTTISEFSLGTVGFSAMLPARTEPLGSFNVGELQTVNLRNVLQIEVSAGLLGGRKETMQIQVPDYYENPEGIRITFRVDETNQYGNLRITWNGNDVFYSNPGPGTYVVSVPSSGIGSFNTLEVSCDGPGLMFWAGTIYVLRDFSVDFRYGPAKLYTFILREAELQSFDRGELSFSGTGSAPLRIRLNGNVVYDKIPGGSEKALFNLTQARLRAGENILSLESSGVASLNNVRLNLFLLTNEFVRTRSFDMTREQYASMVSGAKAGVIEYRIDTIERPGALNIQLNGKSLTIPAPATGTNRTSFTSSQAVEGSNEIRFSGTGSFEIPSVKIGLE